MHATMKKRNRYPIGAAVKHVGADAQTWELVHALCLAIIAFRTAVAWNAMTGEQKEYEAARAMLRDRLEEIGVVVPKGSITYVIDELCRLHEVRNKGAECPNCRRWSSAWFAGQVCPECATGWEKLSRRNPNKILTALPE